jgi:diguanylate cyclase (GGDEF)-like protein
LSVRDPRLAELEFLSELERHADDPQRQVDPASNMKQVDVGNGAYGLGRSAFRDMLHHLLERGLLAGPATMMDRFQSGPPNLEKVWEDLDYARRGIGLKVAITHPGRLRIWELRDRLLADRGREPFGILFDRGAWDREVGVQLVLASASEPYSVLALDLDHFKKVNDDHGHPEGDRVLRRYMEIVRDAVADAGNAYRIGGDELMVSLPLTSLSDARGIAERIRSLVEAEFAQEKPEAPARQVTTSIGVAEFTKSTAVAEAIKLVDVRLYGAKDRGRNCVYWGA